MNLKYNMHIYVIHEDNVKYFLYWESDVSVNCGSIHLLHTFLLDITNFSILLQYEHWYQFVESSNFLFDRLRYKTLRCTNLNIFKKLSDLKGIKISLEVGSDVWLLTKWNTSSMEQKQYLFFINYGHNIDLVKNWGNKHFPVFSS